MFLDSYSNSFIICRFLIHFDFDVINMFCFFFLQASLSLHSLHYYEIRFMALAPCLYIKPIDEALQLGIPLLGQT